MRPVKNAHMTVATFAAAALIWIAAAAAANPNDELISGVVVTNEAGELVIETDEGRKTYRIGADFVVPAAVAPGEIVLVGVVEPGSMDVDRVIVVDEQLVVTEDLEAERALIGTVTAVSPQQLLVKTTTGEQAFVINPDKLFPPLPEADERVAVTYRTLEVHPPQHMATGLVVLPSEVRISEMQTAAEAGPATRTAETETTAPPLPAGESPIESDPLVESDPLTESEAVTALTGTEPQPFEQEEEPIESTFPDESVETQVSELDEAESAETEETTETTQAAAIDESSAENSAEDFDEDLEAEEALPQTAGSMPTLLLVGALALALGAALRFGR